LTTLTLEKVKELPIITGISHCGSLPRHVAERQAKAAKNTLIENNYRVQQIEIEHDENTYSPGSGISLKAANNAYRLIGSDALGRRGLKAEKVGQNAAFSLLKELKTQASVDRFQADMLIPYLALAEGRSSIPITTLTMHVITNIHVAEQFTDVKFDVQGELDSPAKISVTGIGFEGHVASS
jgi:RNA 3'-terminal phosphate cyclase (ATP)